MKHNLVRKTIVETATRLFYQNGYNSTGINEIIKEASIAKATLYNHFKSKEDICLAYLGHMNESFILGIQNHIEEAQMGPKRVVAILDFLRGFYKQPDFGGCWCIKTVAEIPKDNEAILKEIQSQKISLLNLIKVTVESNLNLSKSKNEVLARQLYILYEGAVSESYLHRSDWPIESAIDAARTLIE